MDCKRPDSAARGRRQKYRAGEASAGNNAPVSWSASLPPQLEHHFRWLSRAISDVDADSARFELAQGRPSIAWLVGHLSEGADSVAQAVAGLAPGLPDDFTRGHGQPHWGVTDPQGWARLRATWERIAGRTLQGVGQLTDQDLEATPAIPILPAFAEQLATRHAFLTGEVFHFAYHLGQFGTLRAALGLGWSQTRG